eukprot:m.161433 g.161433  ORF g.161433 m.161433 type:complete len:337 (+) comp23842_c0_seq1:2416-3426(+)
MATPSGPSLDIGATCLRVLNEPVVPHKAKLTQELTRVILEGDRSHWILPSQGTVQQLPRIPARPPSAPHSEYKTKGSSLKTTLHGIAHAEGYAVDLMWDLIGRFSHTLPADSAVEFVADWVRIAGEEAVHFERWSGLLETVCGVEYGDLPTHSGLWEAATASTDDLLTRLALVHMVHEARGLDTSSASLARIIAYEHRHGHPVDTGGPCATTLRMNVAEEIGHVGCAVKWFERVCDLRGVPNPTEKFKEIIECKLRGELKPPFDLEKRAQANMSTGYFLWAGADPADTTNTNVKAHRQALKGVEREQRLIQKIIEAQQARLARMHRRVAVLVLTMR